MPAYVIVDADVLDEATALEYHAVAEPSIRHHGGRYLVAGPTPEAVEGTWESSRVTVIEFPDMEAIRRWYDSPEYTRAREIRRSAVRLRMLFAEGVPG
ncbi:DUF1330 domain-containing protein [Streptomyces pactum]|uniref:DUF1330 domain-containing protein n=1 Tax=Streptomyces pactum TaxID=68249 RepID=A0ABS0NQX7_9ACTN|nr:DUF1330 domain-containing protein [Streptomyces pactum]MBH5337487.1 DUF1330 domain-containing protein [Streptomyces pactum]